MEFMIFRDGSIRVPRRAATSGALGDGVQVLSPQDEDYLSWRDFILRVPHGHTYLKEDGEALSVRQARTRLQDHRLTLH